MSEISDRTRSKETTKRCQNLLMGKLALLIFLYTIISIMTNVSSAYAEDSRQIKGFIFNGGGGFCYVPPSPVYTNPPQTSVYSVPGNSDDVYFFTGSEFLYTVLLDGTCGAQLNLDPFPLNNPHYPDTIYIYGSYYSVSFGGWVGVTGLFSKVATLTTSLAWLWPDHTQEGYIDVYKKQSCTRLCYSGPAGTQDVGVCRAGTQTCSDDTWGVCQGEVLPQPEICDGVDNDCNGVVDNGFECALGKSRQCYDGLAWTMGVGICHGGTQTCNNSCQWDTACLGQALPGEEMCDGRDGNCDGDPNCQCDDSGQGTTRW